jgi:hypothetical protein
VRGLFADCLSWLATANLADIELGLRVLKVCREWVGFMQVTGPEFCDAPIDARVLVKRICDVVGYHEGGE